MWQLNPLWLFFVFTALLALGIFWIHKNTRRIQVNHYAVPVGNMAEDNPLTIVHMTDLHMSPWVLPSHLEKIVSMVNGLHPHYVLITGDFISHYREYAAGCGRALKELKPRRATLAVLGNHDYWVDSAYIAGILKDAGIRVLFNESYRDKTSGQEIAFAGVDDPHTGKDQVKETLSLLPEKSLKILLSHSPDVFHEASDSSAQLMVAGHTHGGQVCAPFLGAIYVPSKYGARYASGWFKRNNTRMYVNRGMGEVFPPVRLFCSREVAVLRLERGEGDPRLIKRDFFTI